MAETSSGSGAGLGLIVGALVVVVAIIAFVMYSGGSFGTRKSVNINVRAPAMSAPAVAGSN